MTQEQGRQRKTRALPVTVASQRRKQIVDAARSCITEEGVEKLTLRKVAERARVSHATIAYYFHTRKELIDLALLEMSEEFMGGLRQRHLVYGPEDLIELVETFLDAKNPSARFVVQMIDAGLHDLELRATHPEFVDYGRERIERSIRVGVESGRFRPDIDPKLGAALIHTLLIWLETELAAEATTREFALDVGRLALKLLGSVDDSEVKDGGRRRPRQKNGGTNGHQPSGRVALASPLAAIDESLLNDPRLSPRAASVLSETFQKLYGLAAGLEEAEPHG